MKDLQSVIGAFILVGLIMVLKVAIGGGRRKP
jgi:hypothetical protein